MHKQKKLLEVPWDNAALGTATWGGVRLADFLKMQGIPYRTLETEEGGRHVEYISLGYMKDAPDEPYKPSIPLIHATTPRADVLLAYERNFEEVTRDHGYPLRVIIPGVIGARSVKWLKEIRISKDECQSSICIPQGGITIPKGATVAVELLTVWMCLNGGRPWEAAECRQGSFPVPRPACPCCGAVPAKVEIVDSFEADGKAACLENPQL